MKKQNILVIFGEEFPSSLSKLESRNSVIMAVQKLKLKVEAAGFEFIPIESYIEPGSVYEASSLAEEISHIKLRNGTRITKSILYEGYELWWIHYDSLYFYFALPYTQYRKLLYYTKDFKNVFFYKPPFENLFFYFLGANDCKVSILREVKLRSFSFLPFGVFLQILITLICLPILMLKRSKFMLFTGDKFEQSKDYDFRLKFIYEELRHRKTPFVEFVRSLESWKIMLDHFFVRRRPVIYSEAVNFLGKFSGFISGARFFAKRKLNLNTFGSDQDPHTRFKILVATRSLLSIYDDIRAIRIMKFILRAIGVKAGYITAALERNFHTVLACKLNNIPTVGILHGAPSRYYNAYDFLLPFDGKNMSVDSYGLWSEWWKEYYLKYSKAYQKDQLFVSGPMRPMERSKIQSNDSGTLTSNRNTTIKVLFISEQLGVPSETVPFLEALLEEKDISLYLKFRPYKDGFEEWLKEYRPDILEKIDKAKIFRGPMNEAIANSDVAVGSHSTAVLEALLQLKPPIFFQSKKWGDCFELKDYNTQFKFFVESEEELIDCIKKSVEIPKDILKKLQERYFGDPYKNGGRWVVDQLEEALKGRITK